MTYNRITWVPDVLKAVKVNVIVEPDFATTGHTAKEGWATFNPQYLFWHHDASPVGPSPGVLSWLKSPARPAQLWVCDGCNAHLPGTWHCITSGVAWHAGLGGPYGSMAKDQANAYSIGIETDHTTGEQWSTQRPLLDSLRVGSAAILKHLGYSADRMLFHKTWAPGRKVDIDGLDLATERSILTTLMKTVPTLPTKPNGVPLVATAAEIQQIVTGLRDSTINTATGPVRLIDWWIATRYEVEALKTELDLIKAKVGA